MKTTVEIDLMVEASEEAKVCLNCDRKNCMPNCARILTKLKELKRKNKERR